MIAEQGVLGRRVYAGCLGFRWVIGLIETGRAGGGEAKEGGGSLWVVGLQSPLLRK